MLARQIGRLRTGLVLTQNRGNLLFRELDPLHRVETDPNPALRDNSAQLKRPCSAKLPPKNLTGFTLIAYVFDKPTRPPILIILRYSARLQNLIQNRPALRTSRTTERLFARFPAASFGAILLQSTITADRLTRGRGSKCEFAPKRSTYETPKIAKRYWAPLKRELTRFQRARRAEAGPIEAAERGTEQQLPCRRAPQRLRHQRTNGGR